MKALNYEHFSSPSRGRQLCALAAVLTLTLAVQTATARGWWRSRHSPCKTQVELAYQSDLYAAKADYLLELGKAESLAEKEDRKEARGEAKEDYKEALEEVRDIRRARLDLCKEFDEERYCPEIDPDNFRTPEEAAANPNPYWRLVPGTTLLYYSDTEDGAEVIQVVVTDETREILGVQCTVVVDTVWLNGELIEDTEDWYAQDKAGNVWYFGEFSLAYEEGVLIGPEGSWESGVDGAKPGVTMFADPVVGKVYRQEFLLGEAEDIGEVIALNQTVTIDLGVYAGCLQTADTTPLEPDGLEHKYYAPGIGMVLEVKPESGETVELVSITTE